MYITPTKPQQTQSSSEAGTNQRRAQSHGKAVAGTRQSVLPSPAGKTIDAGKDGYDVSGTAAFPIRRKATDMTNHGRQVDSVQFYENRALLDSQVATSFNLYTSPGFADQSGFRGRLIDDGPASRRGQDAVATYSEHQLLDERNHFTKVMGIDEYA